jgi:hypothetical protein
MSAAGSGLKKHVLVENFILFVFCVVVFDGLITNYHVSVRPWQVLFSVRPC